jgi:hypothetical protein
VENALATHPAIEDPTLRELLGCVEPTGDALRSEEANEEFELHRNPQIRPVAHGEQVRMILYAACKAHPSIVP